MAAYGTEAHASDATGSLTSLACSKPASTASGDLLVATVSTGSGSTGFTASGWSRPPSPLNVDWTDSNDSAGAVFIKVAGGSEPASYTFSWTTASPVCISIVRVTGSNGTIRSIRRDTAGGTGASLTSTALSGTQSGDLVVAVGINGDDNGVTGATITPPASPWATVNNFVADYKYQATSWLAGPQSTHTATFTSSSSSAWWNIITYAAEPASGASVALTAPNAALAAPLLTPSAGATVALTAPNAALAAPLVTPGGGGTVALTAPNLALAAPLTGTVAGETVALTAPNVALAAPLVTPTAPGAVALTAPNAALAAPLVTPAVLKALALTAPGIALAAPLLTPSGGATVALTAPNVALAAPLVTPRAGSATVALTAPNVALAAPAVTPFVPPVFPFAPLDVRCELNLDGTYTDVSGYVYQRAGDTPPVSITRGRPDESSQANPAACTWEWNNRDGRFSPLNPLSPYFGMLGRNTPVRWSVPAQRNYLRLENNSSDRATAPDAANLDISGSIEMRIAVRLSDWQGGMLAAKWDSGNCWEWRTENVGTMRFAWFDGSSVLNAVSSTAPVPFTTGDFALRLTLDAATGNVTFYTAPSIDGAYTRLGDIVAATGGAATSIRTAASPLTVGYSVDLGFQTCGRVYEFRLYNGIGGTVAADPVFTARSAGTTSWTDAQGNAWSTAGGAEISARDYRFHGEMSAQPPKWDVTGTDQAVMAAAGGPLRRLSQGTANAMSAMKRAILLQTGSLAPQAYWSLEDAAGASVFGASLGGLPMTFDQNPAPDLATDSSFIASAPLPTLNGSRLYGNVAPYSGGSSIVVRWLCKLGTITPITGLTYMPLLRLSTSGTIKALYVVAFAGGSLGLIGYDSTGTDVINTGAIGFAASGLPLYYSAEIQLVSGNVQVSLVTLAPGASSGLAETVTLSGGNVGNCSVISLNPNAVATDTVVGHVTLQTTESSLFALGSPLNGWTGEMAASRYARLAGENGYQARIIGSPAYSAAMGPQSVDTLSSLLNECEAADLGQQFEPRQVLALGYRTLASMCAQPPRLTMDYSQSQPGGVNGGGSDSGLDPTYDDQLLANDWTVTRGSSTGSQGATVQVQLDDGSALSISNPPTGVGDYAKTQTVNTQYDAQLQDTGGWMVHTGTVDQARWPGIPVNLARSEIQGSSLYYPVLDTDIGDYLELLNLPDVVLYDPVKQLLFGSKESLGGFHHTVEFNAVPEVPYEVIILDDPVYGRVDTDGSALASSAAYPQSSLSVSTDAGFPLWTTAAADFPFDINVSGMRLTVTNITGSSSPQTFAVTPAVNGVEKSLAAGADVRLFFPPILALT